MDKAKALSKSFPRMKTPFMSRGYSQVVTWDVKAPKKLKKRRPCLDSEFYHKVSRE